MWGHRREVSQYAARQFEAWELEVSECEANKCEAWQFEVCVISQREVIGCWVSWCEVTEGWVRQGEVCYFKVKPCEVKRKWILSLDYSLALWGDSDRRRIMQTRQSLNEVGKFLCKGWKFSTLISAVMQDNEASRESGRSSTHGCTAVAGTVREPWRGLYSESVYEFHYMSCTYNHTCGQEPMTGIQLLDGYAFSKDFHSLKCKTGES